jgi:hypothetical protein
MSHRNRNLTVLAVISCLVASCAGAPESIESYSYDVGWAFGGDELCSGFASLFDTPDARDRQLDQAAAAALVDRWNGYVSRSINDASLVEQINPPFFLSGMWDSAATSCPEWFPDPSVAGRPGGGSVEQVDVPRIAGLEQGSFAVIAQDQLRPAEASTTSTTAESAYPRDPTAEEIDAIADYYIGRNEAADQLESLQAFWLATSHPALGCTQDDIESILLPPADDPLWETPIVFEPDLNSLVLVEHDDLLGPVAEVNRTNRTIDGDVSAPVRDQFFIVDGTAYQYFECEDSPSDSQLSEASDAVRYIHDLVNQPAEAPAFVELAQFLTSPRDALDSPGEFVSAMRWAWDDFIADVTDDELVAAGEVACELLASESAEAIHDRYHSTLSEATTDSILQGRELFYAGGMVFCPELPAWREWVELDLNLAFEHNYEGLTKADSSSSFGFVGEMPNDEWSEFILTMISDTLEKPLATPWDFGALQAFGAARVLAHPN